MKQTYFILAALTIFSVFTLTSCKNDNNLPEPEKKGLENIKVPDGFTFSTTDRFTVQLQVASSGDPRYENIKFFVYNDNPDAEGVLLASGSVNDDGIYKTVIMKSKIQDSLFIASNITGISLGMVAVEGNEFSYQFIPEKELTVTGGGRNNSAFSDIISDFENGLDGWQPFNDNSIYTSDATNTPIKEGPMGTNDKFIWGFDTRAGVRSYLAPAKFSGDLYGQYIAYHYYLGNTKRAVPVANNIADIRIRSGNTVLAIDLSATFRHKVNAGWQTIYCKLDETETSGSGWRIGNTKIWTTKNGSYTTPRKAATPAQIKQVLHNVTGILIAPEYQVGYFSANGPEFIALGKVGIVSDITSFPVIKQGQNITDSDGDGVPDDTDDYPDDPDKAYNNYSPGEGVYATLAYEDLWPNKGDYDFNDLVIDYNYNVITNAQNKVVEVVGDYMVNATGAGYLNGFAVEFPVSPSTVTGVSGQQLNDNVFSLGSNGTESGQTKTVIPLFEDAHDLFGVTGFVNTLPGIEYHNPVNVRMTVGFDGSFGITSLGAAPYNPFIIADKRRGYEVHLAGYENTDLADTGLFGTGDDDSNEAQSKYYQTSNNLPWAIHIPVSFDYPIEAVSIDNAHLKFVEWAESGGTTYNDWYLDKSGYRNSANIYSHE